MARISAFKNRLTAGARVLGRDAGALIAAAVLPLALYAAALLLPPALATRLGPEWLARLGNLLGTLAFTPVFAALATPTLSAAWRRQPCPVSGALRATGSRILRVLATGVCAWAVTLALLAQAFIGHVVLVCAMAALTVDNRWALPQAKRALAILWGGRTDSLPELTLLFAAWAAVKALTALVGALSGGAAAGILIAIIETGLTALSTAAVMAIYLRERDRQDGWTL